MNPTLRRVLGTVAAGVALTGSLAVSPLAAGAESAPAEAAVSAPAAATAARTQAENERIVRAMYLGFLKREPTTAEKAAGLTKATAGNFASLVSDVSRGDEWLGVFVDDLYNQTLGRDPDAQGKTYWIGELAEGNPSTLIAASVIGSTEFRNLSGNTDDGFIERNYVRVLGRASETEGKTFWLGVLANTSDGEVGAAFFESEENRLRRVANQYDQLLCRAPDSAGHAYWAGVITGGKDVALSEFLATSDEFINNAIAGKCLATITNPDPDPDPDPDTPPDPATVCAGSPTPAAECEALVTLFNATGGDDWAAATKAGWNSDNEPCSWNAAAIECVDNKITKLNLFDSNVAGVIPDDMLELTSLTDLLLGGNPGITGLPSNISALTSLLTFNVTSTGLTQLPTGFASTAVTRVNISMNNLSGGLGDLESATGIIQLQANQAGLSALDVTSFAGSLVDLDIYNTTDGAEANGMRNAFTALPTGLAGASNLETFRAGYNKLSSVDGIQALTKLEKLWLFNNAIAIAPDGMDALVLLTPAVPANPRTDDALRFASQCGGSGVNATPAGADTDAFITSTNFNGANWKVASSGGCGHLS